MLPSRGSAAENPTTLLSSTHTKIPGLSMNQQISSIVTREGSRSLFSRTAARISTMRGMSTLVALRITMVFSQRSGMYQRPRFLCDDPEEFYHIPAFLFSDDLALPDHQAGLFYQCYGGFCIEVTEIHRRPEPFACPAGSVPASKAGKKYAP